MILAKIDIANFQSIQQASLELGAWTSLVGESDIAKSAVVRAMHAALTNRTGDALIRHGAPGCSVWLTLATGEVIGWHKKRGKGGTYTLSRPESRAEPETFEKTNGTVPEAIAALLRVTIDIAGDDMTPGFQRQHDAPFLLADTPRRRAQILGEFDGTNITIRAEGLIRTTQRRAQADLKGDEKALESVAATLALYEPLAVAQGAVAAAEAALTASLDRRLRIDKVKQAALRIAAQSETRERASEALLALGDTPHPDAVLDAGLASRRISTGRALATRWSAARSAGARGRRAAGAIPAIDYGPGFAGRTQRLNDGARLVARWRQSRAVAGRSGAIHAALASAPDVAARAERVQQGATLRTRWQDASAARGRSATSRVEVAWRLSASRTLLAALRGEECPTCGEVMQLTDVP